MTWQTNRRAQLPPDWAKRRAQVKARAHGQCEMVKQGQRCPNPGNECHHTGSNTDHSLVSLQWVCTPCHKAETQAQAQGARGVGRARKRTPKPPPGLL